MSTTHEDEVFKLTLLSNQNDQAQLGPFDGLVAALLHDGVHFITSPNQPMIPMPPLGAREQTDWSPSQLNSRIGKVRLEIVRDLHAAINPILDRARRVLKQLHNDLLSDLIQALTSGVSIVEFTSRSYFEMKYAIRATQRLWLELVALLDYTEVFRPRMDGRVSVSSDTAVAHTVGVFISIHHVAHVYHLARLPFWFIEKRTLFSDQNIMIVIELTPPDTIIETAAVGAPTPYVNVGEFVVWHKFRAIQNMAAQSIKHNDPFHAPVPSRPTPSLMAPTPQTVPPQHTRLSSTSTPQIHNRPPPRALSSLKSASKNSRQSKSRGRHIKPPVQDKAPGSNTPPTPPSFFPFSIQSWTHARASVNTDFTLLVGSQHENDKKTYLPDISIFITSSPARNTRWLTIWPLVRQACISRVETSIASATPLTYQEWRTFLFASPTSRMDAIGEAMAPALSACGIPLESLYLVPSGEMPSDDVARGMLWEMAEYNFRCDILSLHHRIRRPDVPDTIGDERLAAALSTPGMSGIFDFDRTTAASGLGLASPVPQTRLLVLRPLRQLMQCWQGDRPPIINVNDSSTSRAYVAELESAITTYFCQTFFNNFGRVPSIPFSLHPILP
ncbi:hypothetical protein BDN72DRAFT_905222 [Pluteus cervinus]|uniref:Uncharacterized protein n=1 Tax=Pluteus cervinus TaxID=181527 RepID=A0ACD3A369_9AGAR|nr:hypothetical protein BDN72DRAFT_905222 [Pluteus cervinus]